MSERKATIEKLIVELGKIGAEASVSRLERKISQSFDEFVEIDDFYQLPFSSIKNILNLANISDYTEASAKPILKTLITKMCEKKKQDAPLLLSVISNPLSTLDECMSLLGCFRGCPLCVRTYSLYEEDSRQVDFDYEFEISEKEKVIKQLSEKIQALEKIVSFKKDMEEPLDYEPNIIEAAIEGKLTSVQYLIDHEGIDPNFQSSYGYTPLHYACQEGHLDIVMYLVGEKHADVNLHKDGENTALCDAAYNNRIDIVQYLVKCGANINDKGWM